MRWQIALAVAAGVATTGLAAWPDPLVRLFPRYGVVADHLPGGRLDSGDPIYFHVGYERPARVNTAAIRRAATLVPDDAVYYFRGSSGPTSENLMLAARLFFLPAVQSQRSEPATWILSYRDSRPPARWRRRYELDRDLRLTEVR